MLVTFVLVAALTGIIATIAFFILNALVPHKTVWIIAIIAALALATSVFCTYKIIRAYRTKGSSTWLKTAAELVEAILFGWV